MFKSVNRTYAISEIQNFDELCECVQQETVQFIIVKGVCNRYIQSGAMGPDAYQETYLQKVRDLKLLDDEHDKNYGCTVLYLPRQNVVWGNFLRNRINGYPTPYPHSILDLQRGSDGGFSWKLVYVKTH